MEILLILLFGVAGLGARSWAIGRFKIVYYEAKLKHRDVDISDVENITLWQIIKL